MKRAYFLLMLIAGINLITCEIVTAEPSKECSSISSEKVVQKVVATASTFSNLKKSVGSLRFESEKMFKDVEKILANPEPPENLCPSHCSVSRRPEVVFRSIPKKYLTEYSELEKCSGQLKSTESSPLKYENREFASIGSLNEWYGEFSQGKGKDGKDLYSRCDGSCSPQYTTLISKPNASYSVTAEVVCGHARDKDDNNYDLSFSVRWACAKS